MATPRSLNTRPETLDEFDTTSLLRAVDQIDQVRQHFDGDGYKPPEIRDQVLKAHQLAMRIVNEGSQDKAARAELFELIGDVQWQVDEAMEALRALQDTVDTLVGLEPMDEDD